MSETVVLHGEAGIRAMIGQQIGPSPWREIRQVDIDQFGEATGDHQWIHVDPVRAARGPFGVTIAHGYLTLALVPVLLRQLYRVEPVRAGINYGIDGLRFLSPVRVGESVRARVTLTALSLHANGARLESAVVVEVTNSERPALVMDHIGLLQLD